MFFLPCRYSNGIRIIYVYPVIRLNLILHQITCRNHIQQLVNFAIILLHGIKRILIITYAVSINRSAYIRLACENCHTTGYTGTPTECYACHQSDYENTTDPNHVTQNYPHDCTLCHNTSNWDDANFDHNTTQFPLTGAHIQVSCENCHSNGYTGTPTDCFACHQDDFNGTTDPPHHLL